MTKIEELTDEIRKLRKDVKELREAGQWPRIQYVPQPYPIYVPPQPYPWPWYNGTTTVTIPMITWSNVPSTGVTTVTTNAIPSTTTTYLLNSGTAA